ncbi:MAG: hypothetical protein D6738_15510, partial [Acidobacteria bacterium]
DGLSPPPEWRSLARLGRIEPERFRLLARRLAEERRGLLSAERGLEVEDDLADSLLEAAIETIPETARRILCDPQFSERAMERLGRLRASARARELAASLLAPGTIRECGIAAIREKRHAISGLTCIAPREVAGLLAWALRDIDAATLREQLAGDLRRTVVFALEQLLFRSESAATAVRLLERLALAENESWANNAAGLFGKLFLPGDPFVALSLDERLEHLREMVAADEPARRALVLEALEHVFDMSRSGWQTPREEHWIVDGPPPGTDRAAAERYFLGALELWERLACSDDVGQDAWAKLAEEFVGVLSVAYNLALPAIADRLAALVASVVRNALHREEDPRWLHAFLRWEEFRARLDETDEGRGQALRVIDAAVARMRGQLFPDDAEIAPGRLLRRWLGGAVPRWQVAAGREPRPLEVARQIARRFARNPGTLEHEDLEWLVGRESVLADCFWRALGRIAGARAEHRELLFGILDRYSGPEALGAWVRGVLERKDANRHPGLVDDVLGRVLARSGHGPEAGAVDIALRVLYQLDFGQTSASHWRRVLEAGVPDPVLATSVLRYPQRISQLAGLPADFLLELSGRCVGPEHAPLGVVFLQALVERFRAGRGEEAADHIAAAWELAARIGAHLGEEYDRWSWGEAIKELARVDRPGVVRFLKTLLPAAVPPDNLLKVSHEIARIHEDLADDPVLRGALTEALLEAAASESWRAVGWVHAADWIDPERDGERLLAWVQARGDERAFLIAARALDFDREVSWEIACRLLELVPREGRGRFGHSLACAASTNFATTDLAGDWRRRASLARKLAERASRSDVRGWLQATAEQLEREADEHERDGDEWMRWDRDLGGASIEEILRERPRDDELREWAVLRVMESVRPEDV